MALGSRTVWRWRVFSDRGDPNRNRRSVERRQLPESGQQSVAVGFRDLLTGNTSDDRPLSRAPTRPDARPVRLRRGLALERESLDGVRNGNRIHCRRDLWRPMLPNPDDLVLETAVNGHAEAVITFNRRHFEPAAARFGIEILAPAEAVRRLEDRS